MTFESRFKTMFRDESTFPKPLFMKSSKEKSTNNNTIKRRKSFSEKFFKTPSGGTLKLSAINTLKLKELIFPKDKINKEFCHKEKIDFNSNRLKAEVEYEYSSPSSLPPTIECLPLSENSDYFLPVSSSSSIVSFPKSKPLKSPSQNKFRTFKRNDPYFSSYGTIKKEKLNRSRVSWVESQDSDVESIYCSSPLSYTLPLSPFINSPVSSLSSNSIGNFESKSNFYGSINRTESTMRTNYSSRISPAYGKPLPSNLSKFKFASENCLSQETCIPKLEASFSSDSFSSDNSLHMASPDCEHRSLNSLHDTINCNLQSEMKARLTILKDKSERSSTNGRLEHFETNMVNSKRISPIIDNECIKPNLDGKKFNINKGPTINGYAQIDNIQTEPIRQIPVIYEIMERGESAHLGYVNNISLSQNGTEIRHVNNSDVSENSTCSESLSDDAKNSTISNDSGIIKDFHEELLLKCAKFKSKMNSKAETAANSQTQLFSNHGSAVRCDTNVYLQEKPSFLKPIISPKPKILPKPDSRKPSQSPSNTPEFVKHSRCLTIQRSNTIKPEKPMKPRNLAEASNSFRVNSPAPEINNNCITNSRKFENSINSNKIQIEQMFSKTENLQNRKPKLQNSFSQNFRNKEKMTNHSSLTNLSKLKDSGPNNTLKVKDLVASFNKAMITSSENLAVNNNDDTLAFVPKNPYSISQKSLSEFNLACPRSQSFREN